LLATLADYDAARQGVRAALAGRFGDLHLTPGYEFDQGDNKWSLGIGAPLPIFDRNEGAIAAATAQLNATRAKVEQTQTDALAELYAARTAYERTRDQLTRVNANAADLKRQLEVAGLRVEAGEASRFELAQRAAEVANAELARITAMVALQEAIGRIEDVMQHPAVPFPSVERAPRIEDTQ
jgi:outer membrane protein TolC